MTLVLTRGTRSLARACNEEAGALEAIETEGAAALAANRAEADAQDGGVPAPASGGAYSAAGTGAAGYGAASGEHGGIAAASVNAALGGVNAGVYAWGLGPGAVRVLEAAHEAALAASHMSANPGGAAEGLHSAGPVGSAVGLPRGYANAPGGAEGPVPEYGGGGFIRSAGNTDGSVGYADAERLSAFFERDARRYGGAFELL